MVEDRGASVRFDGEGNVVEYVRTEHDEAMRMQALAVGTRAAVYDSHVIAGASTYRATALDLARWAYREATGREW